MSLTLPIQQKERIVIVDVLRGFALFGVLLGNFNGMVTNYVPDSIIKSISTPFDNVLNMLHDVFVQNKFMTLFSILFGYGFGVIMERVANKNLNTTHFFLRRMFWLFVFGCIHLAFWAEDILHVYAMAGIFLLLFRKSSDRKVFVWSLILMFVVPFIIRLCQHYFIRGSVDYDTITKVNYNTVKYGSLKDVAVFNYKTYPHLWIYTLVEFRDGAETLGRFLLGYYILRKQILVRLNEYSTLIKKVWRVSFFVMIVYIGIWLLSYYNIFTEQFILYPFLKLGILATALFYATSVILIFQKGTTKLMQVFSNTGRMTLTNYLVQTAVYIILFYNIGFTLLGELPLRIIWIAAFLLYFLQAMLSRWWLSKFLYGPVEWIWRQLTYQKRFTLLKSKKIISAAA